MRWAPAAKFLIAPLTQTNINAFGWVDALLILAILLAVVVPLSYVLKGKTADHGAQTEKAESSFKHLTERGSIRAICI